MAKILNQDDPEQLAADGVGVIDGVNPPKGYVPMRPKEVKKDEGPGN